MNLNLPLAMITLIFATTTGAATSALPAQILCTPDEYHRTGLEKLDVPGDTAQLFEYGGKVTVTKNGDRTHYDYGEGQDFYRVKEKPAYSKDFVDLQQDIFLVSDPGWADSSGFLLLRGESQGGFFHIAWATQRYYGFIRDWGAVHSYAGSCTQLKK
jgi:hypothetical protein